MDKDIIKRIILQQQEFVSKVRLTKRDIVLERNVNYVLVGMRRAGKSYILYQYIQELLSDGHSAEEILFINFEDERICDITKDDLHLILESYRELFSHEQPYIFLDEIQNVKGWEHYARRLADEKKHVLITGSNANMLSREISAALGGRYVEKEVYPFSFGEFLKYKGLELPKHWLLSPVKSDVVRLFSEYFYNGGIAETFDIQDKRTWHQSLYQKILYSDVLLRKNIRNERSLGLLVRKLAESVMQPMSIKRLQNILQGDGSRISRETVSNYLSYLQESYITFGISNFSNAVSERESIRKHYFFDNGILNLFLFQPETKLLENLVAIFLYRKYGDRLHYYSRNVEVDFCIPDDGTLVQVSYDISDRNTLERETVALIKTAGYLKCSSLKIITFGQEQTIEKSGYTIEIIPAWKFVLEQ